MSVKRIKKYRGYEYWYDHSVRVWYAARFDENGYQLSDTLDAAYESGIKEEIEREYEI
jgi:hypothetical protein